MTPAGKIMVAPGPFNAFEKEIAIVIDFILGGDNVVLQCNQSKKRFDC